MAEQRGGIGVFHAISNAAKLMKEDDHNHKGRTKAFGNGGEMLVHGGVGGNDEKIIKDADCKVKKDAPMEGRKKRRTR